MTTDLDSVAAVNTAFYRAFEARDLDAFPLPEANPDFYVDYGETGPYIAEVGAGECAAG